MKHSCCTILACGVVMWTACASAQPAAPVRVLSRSSQDTGPQTLDRQAVAPLFDSGAPADTVGCLAAEGDDCADGLAAWIDDHGEHPHVAEALFLLGYLSHERGRHSEALTQLTAAAPDLGVLADHAFYFAAESAFALEQFEDTVGLALSVPEGSVYGPRGEFLRGRALRELGRLDSAQRVLQSFITAYPNAYYIATVELELGRTLVALERYDEAGLLFARVAHRYPGSDEESVASDALDGIRSHLSDAVRDQVTRITDEDLVARAQVLFRRHRSDEVIELLNDELDRLDVDSPLGCQATWLVGKSYSKLRDHDSAIPYYQRIIGSTCEDEDTRVKSLYVAGQALWNEDRDAEAIDHFSRLYREHATHSYADDAMLYEARINRAAGNQTRYLQVLEEQVRRFPAGDMLADAHWLLFEHEFASGNYDTAVAFAQAMHGQTGENAISNRGRIAYFAARAQELSAQPARAEGAFEQLIRDTPLSYYALLAFNRLRVLNESRAGALVSELRVANDTEQTVGVPIEPGQIADDASFQRGLLLLRLGLMDLAEAQFDRLLDAYPNQDSPLWLVTFLFDAAGAFHLSHDIPRRRIASFMAAYPDPGSSSEFHMAFPMPFLDLVDEAAQRRSLDRYLIYAIMREESGFNPRVESWANARGLMQLMTGTAEDMADRVGMRRLRSRDLFRPEVAVSLGSEYLLRLSEQYDANPILVIAGYNGGIGNVNRFLRENGHLPIDQFVEEIPFGQTRNYVKHVTQTYWIYHWLYADDPILRIDNSPPQPNASN